MTLPAAALAVAFAIQADPPQAPSTPPAERPAPDAAADRAVARVNGEELSLQSFEDWIVRAHGWRFVDDFIDLTLLRQESRRLGLELPTRADIEAAFEQEWRDRIEMRGDEAQLLADLKSAGMDKSSYRDRQLGNLEQETLARRILKSREPTEATLNELFVKEFGKEGVRTHVRLAFFDRMKGLKIGAPTTKETALQLAASAKERAQAFFDQAKRDRGQFATLLADSDRCIVERLDATPQDTRKSGGEIPRLRPDWLGGVVSRALVDAKSGDLVGPIEAPSGAYVVDVVARAPVAFAEVQAELRELWKSRIPAVGETHALREELRKAAKIEKLGINEKPDPQAPAPPTQKAP